MPEKRTRGQRGAAEQRPAVGIDALGDDLMLQIFDRLNLEESYACRTTADVH